MKNTTIHIVGTHCKACKSLIEDVCKDIEGVQSCNVDFQTGNTVIEHEEGLNLQLLKKEIEELGQYTVEINS